MKKMNAIFCLFLLSSFVAHTAIGGTFDTFPDSQINKNKWRYVEQGVEVLNNKLVLTKRTLSLNPDHCISNLWAQSAAIPAFTPAGNSSFQANMSLAVNYGSSETNQEAWAKLSGTFYQDTNISDDVVASVIIHHSAGTTNVTAEYNLMYLGTYMGAGNVVAGGSGVFPYTGSLGEEVTALISYNDATNTFTFRIAPASTYNPSDSNTYDEVTVKPGHTTGAPSLAVRALLAENQVHTDQEVQVVGTFDDIFIDGSLFDDFSTTLFDPAKWQQSDPYYSALLVTRRIDNNRLMLALQNNGWADLRTEARFNSGPYFTDYIEAEFTISSDTVMTSYPSTDPNPATVAQARLEAHQYSDTYDSDTPIDRVGENRPRVNITVVNFDGTYGLYASARIYRCSDAACDNGTTWKKQYLGCNLSLDTPIKVSLERDGNNLIFGCNNSYYTCTIPVMYDLPYYSRLIRGVVYSSGTDIGYLKFYADNVKIEKGAPWNLFLPAIINSSKN